MNVTIRPERNGNGLKIINEYNLLDISNKTIGELVEVQGVILLKVPVFVRLLRCKDFICELIVKISYTPYYRYYYIWPGDEFDFTTFLPIISRGLSNQQQCELELDTFRKILEYIEINDNNKRYLFGKKYGLK